MTQVNEVPETAVKPHSIIASTKSQHVKSRELFSRINYPFLTLRLPSKQIHTDAEIISKILVPFLKNFNTETVTIQYLFREDVDADGNIYFSLMYDAVLNKTELFEKWAECTENLGYMTRAEKLKTRAEKRNEAIAEHQS
ncbi:hypothetical protein [Emticicia sp. W12TSBA100-4]|uniref:hypothetical protein n=1 Tax=Emticicia sp. W12TSBA100-4 TaxID=3160965 RepID=UPI0033065736